MCVKSTKVNNLVFKLENARFLEKVKKHVPSWKGNSLLFLLMNQNGISKKKKGALHFIKLSKKNFKNYSKSNSTRLETF